MLLQQRVHNLVLQRREQLELEETEVQVFWLLTEVLVLLVEQVVLVVFVHTADWWVIS
jgi:hypothetical protein